MLKLKGFENIPLCGILFANNKVKAQFERQSFGRLMIEICEPTGLKNVETNNWEKIMSLVSGKSMMLRDAIRFLMLSPLYFRLSLVERKNLVQEFCDHYGDVLLTPQLRRL